MTKHTGTGKLQHAPLLCSSKPVRVGVLRKDVVGPTLDCSVDREVLSVRLARDHAAWDERVPMHLVTKLRDEESVRSEQ